jgi:hypothetical protein
MSQPSTSIVASLQATPDPVVVDLDAGATDGTTQVEYWKNPDEGLWYRDRPGAWWPVELAVTGPEDAALSHGVFTSVPLEPGQVYEVTIWAGDEDPNNPTVEPLARPLATLAVFALKKRPERRQFLDNEDVLVGGTRRTHHMTTVEPVNAYEAVGTQPPQPGPDGLLRFPTIVSSTWAPLADNFQLVVGNLLPGTGYHALTRLSDHHGNWEFLDAALTTKLRRIELSFASIYINDDSDETSGGEGYIALHLETGNAGPPEKWKSKGSLEYHGDYSSGDTVNAPPGVIVAGPEAVVPETSGIRVKVFAEDDDTTWPFISRKDVAWGAQELSATDSPNEDVIDHQGAVVAGPGDDGLKVTVGFKYSVKYL